MSRVAATFPAPPPLPPGRRYANPVLLGPFDRAGVVSLQEWLSSGPRAMFLGVMATCAAIASTDCGDGDNLPDGGGGDGSTGGTSGGTTAGTSGSSSGGDGGTTTAGTAGDGAVDADADAGDSGDGGDGSTTPADAAGSAGVRRCHPRGEDRDASPRRANGARARCGGRR